jgi:hypothetical protein
VEGEGAHLGAVFGGRYLAVHLPPFPSGLGGGQREAHRPARPPGAHGRSPTAAPAARPPRIRPFPPQKARRRRLVVEQQSARAAAEARADGDALLDLLASKGAAEAELGARLWRLRREEGAMREARALREAEYAAAREAELAGALAREAAMGA